MHKIWMLLILSLMSSVINATSQSREGSQVYLISPKDGQTVKSPIKLSFGLKGMTLAEAGIDIPFSGHHHLLINVDHLPDMNLPIPADERHIHFGKGQTEVELELSEGEHTLQLLLGDFRHIPHDPPIYSKRIKIFID